MRKSLFQGFLSIALIVTMMMAFMPAFAQEQVQAVQVDGLLVYAEPNAASQLIAVMSLGSQITVFDQVENGFTKIRIPDGREGWAILTLAGAPAGATDAGGGGGDTGGSTGVIVEARGNVRIRDAASLSAARIGLMGWGEQAEVLSQSSNGDWLQVRFQGLTGWVASAWFVTVQGSLSGVAAGQSTADASGGGTAVADGTQVQALGNVRLRAEPSLNGERIGLAPWGAVATLLAFDESGDWAQINYEGIIAWSAVAWWQVVSGDVTSTATAGSSTTTNASAAPQGTTLMAVGNVRVRAEPSLNGERVTGLGWGEIVGALAISSDGDWVKINANGIIGWAATTWFEVKSGSLSGLPVEG